MQYKAIVIGTSAGGLAALSSIIPKLPQNFPLPILIVQHMAPSNDAFLAEYLNKLSKITVVEAQEKEKIKPGTAYIAPGGYHLLIEENYTLSINSDWKINYSRPSIDVLFESASDIFQDSLIGIILTGANNDGSKGLSKIKKNGGMVIVQDPKTAEASCMPEAAIMETCVDHIINLNEIAPLLYRIIKQQNKTRLVYE